jgi:hypothetical protein
VRGRYFNALLLAGFFVAEHMAWALSPSPTGLTFAVLAGLLLYEVDWKVWFEEQ